MPLSELKEWLDEKYLLYHQQAFVDDDPICIPHAFTKPADVEISGFLAATFAWGQRVTIINKTRQLLQLMDHAPHDFVQHFEPRDLDRFAGFKHRTFNTVDLEHFLGFLQMHYRHHPSLESAFAPHLCNIQESLVHFHEYFFSLPHTPQRTKKHVATPARKSTCKRLNMFLRWMVRTDQGGVDFGLWKRFTPSQLMCPLDVHVERVARKIALLQRPQRDWQAVEELTQNLRKLDPYDPVKYDFALFGLGVMEKF